MPIRMRERQQLPDPLWRDRSRAQMRDLCRQALELRLQLLDELAQLPQILLASEVATAVKLPVTRPVIGERVAAG